MNRLIISANAEKVFDKIQYPFMIKNTQQTRTRRKLPSYNKVIGGKPLANIILNGERPKAFSLSLEQGNDAHFHNF